MKCDAVHAKHGACERTDAHEWHKAKGEKWKVDAPSPAQVPPKESSAGAAVAVPAELEVEVQSKVIFVSPAAREALLASVLSGANPETLKIAEQVEAKLRGAPVCGACEESIGRCAVHEAEAAAASEQTRRIADTLAKQQAAQVEQPDVDKSVAPEGTVRAVYTGSAASKLAPAIDAEMKRLLALKPDLVPLDKKHPTDPPRAQCPACDVIVVGFDASHGCTKEDVLKKLKPRGLHEALGDKLKFSGRYRLCIWRDPEGQYHLAEELVDTSGAIVAFNVLDGGEGWGYMGARILDLVVEKFTP